MKKRISLLCTVLAMCLLLAADSALAQFTQVWKVDSTTWPIQGFNTNNMRGAALNKATGHYLVARKDLPRIYVFNAATGALLDSLNMTGVAGGGGSALQDIEVTTDGVVYATNLVGTPISASDTTFKIYRWADDNNATVPTVAFSGRPLDKNGRFGDAFDVAGTGTGTVIYVGGNNAGTDSVLVFTTTDGSAFTNSSIIKITGNDAGMGIAQISAGGDFLTSRYSSGSPIRLYSGTSAGRLDAVPATVTPAFQADITYLEAAGRKWVASVESLATLGHAHKAVLLNTTYGLSGAVKVGATPVIGINANTTSIGADVELQYNAADSTMTVFLMVDNNGIAAYKSGNLLTINLPPFGGNIVRSQFIPMAGQNDTIFVDVQDDQYIPADSVKLNYNLNEGANTVVSMTRISGDSVKGKYRGIIPASVHTNAARITYYVTVSDNQGVRFVGATAKYFAGLTKMTLAGPRAIDTANGVNLWVGYGIRVQGVCTQEDSLIAIPTSRHDVVLQDASGAMDFIEFAVNSVAPPWRMKRGRVYTAAGLISQYNGKIQVAIPATGKSLEVSDDGPGVSPVPVLVTIRDLAFDKRGEELENALVKISNVRLTASSLPWPAAGAAGTNITITDNGIDSLTLRVPALSSANGFPPLRKRFSVVGTAGQYDASSPYKDGYQLMMRQVDDLSADVRTGFKDTTFAPLNSEVVLPVSVDNVNGLGINGFKFDAKFDSTALQFVSASNVNSISSAYTFSSNLLNGGAVRVVGSGATALVDSGVLYALRFKVLKMGSFAVTMNGSFNEGSPTAAVQNGIVVGTYPTEAEPNDSLKTATPMAIGSTVTGTLSKTTGDPDFFGFTSQVGHFMADVTDASGNTDADVYLYDSTGKMLYNIDRNLNDRLEFNLPYSGKYFVKVSGFFDGTAFATGPYQLFIHMDAATDANEPNDGPLFGFMNIATPITFNSTDTTNTLNPGVGIPGNDYDYFRLIATPGQTITAVIQMKTFKATTTLNNVQAKIYRKGTFPTALVTASKTDGSDITISHTVAVADTYYVRVINVTGSEAGPNARYKLTVSPPTGVIGHLDGIPLVYSLDQNYPNPFNPSTTIRFALPNDASTKLVVYDMLGREVRTLVNNNMNAGYHQIIWNGRNNNGSVVASGMFIYRIEAGSFVSTKKMMLLK